MVLLLGVVPKSYPKSHIVIAYNRYKKAKGFGVTPKGDTVSGYFYISYYKGIIYRSVQEGRDSLVSFSNFKSVFLETEDSSNAFVQFDYLEKYQRTCRLVYSGRLKFYDENLSSRNPDKLVGAILIFRKGSDTALREIKPVDDNGSYRRIQKRLLDFLNAQTQEKYTNQKIGNSLEIIRKIDEAIPAS